MSSPVAPSTTCTQCGATASGRFCAECGAPLTDAPCAGCGETLSAGAKFCHRCGLPVGRGAAAAAAPVAKASGLATTLPWAVAGIAFLALFAMLAGKGFNAKRGSTLDAPSNALPNPALDGAAAPGMQGSQGDDGSAGDNPAAPFAGMVGATPGAMGGASGGRAPDISNMTPAQLAERLFNRIMVLNSQGKKDSVLFFSPMAIQAYQMLRDQQGHPWDLDQRYDVGRIAEVAGAFPVAQAQADTILQQSPTHLLGLLLAAHVAKATGNSAEYQSYAKRFTSAKSSELARNLPEYQKHQSDITSGL